MSGALAGSVKTLANLAGAADMTAGLPDTPAPPLPPPGIHPPAGPVDRGTVSLFLGCTADLADRDTVHAALRLLNCLGFRVNIPAGQTCCGALHQHAGEAAEAHHRIQQNLLAFESPEESPLISFASGCGAMLAEYEQIAPGDAASRLVRRFRDISQFLAEQDWPEDLALSPLSQTVCLHSPCSLKNVLRADRHAGTLLRRIPGLEIIPLPAEIRCCGAAGSYMIDHPRMASALRDDVLERIAAIQPACLLTSNPGCAMHLRAGLKQRGLGDVAVLHPVTLLARQLPA
jgi:glycolate oxidase iron-sulfur subunit